MCNAENNPNENYVDRKMSRRTRHGLTMLEIIVSLVLVSTILLVSLSASGDLMRNTADSYAAMDSREVIGVFLDEISALDFQDRDEPSHYGPESGEIGTNRTNLEDVDDFFDFFKHSAEVSKRG